MLFPSPRVFPSVLLFPGVGAHGPVPPGRTHVVDAQDRTETVAPR